MDQALEQLNRLRNNIFEKTPHEDVFEKINLYLIYLRRSARLAKKLSEKSIAGSHFYENNKDIFKKTKIRDHFEHAEDKTDKDFLVSNPVGIPMLMADNGTKLHIGCSLFDTTIVSGDYRWDLIKDHDTYCNIFSQLLNKIDLPPKE